MVQTNASQCPFSGGNAVIVARNFIELFYERLDYDDEGTCSSQGIYKLSNNSTSTINDVQIIPNPANDFVTIETESIPISKIELFSGTGQMVFSKENIKGINQWKVDVRNFDAGLYLIKLSCGPSEIFYSKFVITR